MISGGNQNKKGVVGFVYCRTNSSGRNILHPGVVGLYVPSHVTRASHREISPYWVSSYVQPPILESSEGVSRVMLRVQATGGFLLTIFIFFRF